MCVRWLDIDGSRVGPDGERWTKDKEARSMRLRWVMGPDGIKVRNPLMYRRVAEAQLIMMAEGTAQDTTITEDW